MSWARIADAALEATIVGSFTSIGYRARRSMFDFADLDGIRMDGRVVLITGATSGIGYAGAQQLAGMGAEVVVIGRNSERTERATAEIRRHTGGTARHYVADMSDLDAVRDVVREIHANEPRLHVIINNAGALSAQRQESPQGNELSLATMVLGPLVLTEGLVDLLADSGGGRVVNVASGGMYTQALALDDLQSEHGYRGSVAYARAKRALVVLSEEWAQRWEPRGVVVHSMHPGWAATPGVHESLPTFERVVGPLLRTPEEGADTAVWLAAADEPGRCTGRFWHDRRARSTHYLPRTRETAAQREGLWRALHTLVA